MPPRRGLLHNPDVCRNILIMEYLLVVFVFFSGRRNLNPWVLMRVICKKKLENFVVKERDTSSFMLCTYYRYFPVCHTYLPLDFKILS
jgi:hypothetical protein